MVAHIVLYVTIAVLILAPVVGLTLPHVRARFQPQQSRR